MAVPPKPGGARACCAVRGRARCLVSMLLLWMLPLSLLVCSRACCSCLRACDAPADAVRLLRRRLAAGAVDGRMSKFSGPFSREFQLFFQLFVASSEFPRCEVHICRSSTGVPGRCSPQLDAESDRLLAHVNLETCGISTCKPALSDLAFLPQLREF